MGTDYSKDAGGASRSDEPITYFAINLKQPDKVHIVPANNAIANIIVKVLENHHSVQEHGYTATSVYTVKVAGNPFSPSLGDSESASMSIKSTFCRLLAELATDGWRVVTASDLAQRRANSTIFFRRMVGQLAGDPNCRPLTCLAPSGWDKLFLVNIPKSLESRTSQLVENKWGLQESKIVERGSYGCTIRMKLSGNPWSGASGSAGVQLRQLLLDLVKMLQEQDFKFVTNISFKGTSDCFFFELQSGGFSLSKPEEMFAVSLNRTDRLRVIAAPADILHLVAGVIQQTWARGIQQVRTYHGSQEYKLSGTPWWAGGDQAVESRRLISSLLAALRRAGWEVAVTAEISRQVDDKTLILFRGAERPGPEAPCKGGIIQMINWVCVSFHETDKLRLLSGPGASVDGVSQLEAVVRYSLEQCGEGVIQRERKYHSATEWKITGTPFSGSYGTGDQQRLMIAVLCSILREFNTRGWKLVASADISAKYHATKHERYPLDVHSWFFLQEPSDRLHLAALNPPSYHLSQLLTRAEEGGPKEMSPYSQFDLPPAYHQIVSDN